LSWRACGSTQLVNVARAVAPSPAWWVVT